MVRKKYPPRSSQSIAWAAGGFILTLLLLSACGVKRASDPSVPVEPVELATFKKENLRLVNNKIFLWKEPSQMTPEDVSKARAIGREIDRLDGLALPLNRRELELEAEIEKKSEGDPAEIKTLQAELLILQERKFEIEIAAGEQIATLMTLVEYYDPPPTSVYLSFDTAGMPHLSVSGWDFHDGMGERYFSTDAEPGTQPTIDNLTYGELGGTLNFRLILFKDATQKELVQTLEFTMARTNYDAPDGRKFFGGEIVRTRYSSNKVQDTRRGVAKFVDKNN